MPVAPYDSSAGGPSQAGAMDRMQGADVMQTTFDTKQLAKMQNRLQTQYTQFDRPALESSLGASGQYYGTAARHQEAQQQLNEQNQSADLSTAFARSQMEMKRQEIFAGLGLVL